VASSVPFFLAAGSSSAAGCAGAVQPNEPHQRFTGLTGGRLALVRGSAATLRARSRIPGDVMNGPVPLARKMMLQVAVRDIGQLTDL